MDTAHIWGLPSLMLLSLPQPKLSVLIQDLLSWPEQPQVQSWTLPGFRQVEMRGFSLLYDPAFPF
jgi:hypothetical protein